MVKAAPSYPIGNVPSSAGQLSFERHKGVPTADAKVTSYRRFVGLSTTETLKSRGSARRNGLAQAAIAMHSKVPARILFIELGP